MTPPPLRDAATIILTREKNRRLEFYLLKRSTKSGFMGGLYVFPGGTVDDPDRGAEAWLPCMDITGETVKQQLCDDHFNLEAAVAFGVAAIRETLEEAGVLIASQKDRSENDFQNIARLRLSQDLPADWFNRCIQSEKWTLLFSNLGRWSHWITPARMKKRFDTRFFIVLMPDDQQCVPDDLETQHGIWLPAKKALEQNLDGQTPLSPPTIVTLTELSTFNSLQELTTHIKKRPWGEPISPVMLPSDTGPVIIEPWDHAFATPDLIRLTDLSEKVLPAGASFSRIWCDQGHWKPISENET